MSSNWVKDIKDMQEKFGVDEWMNNPANRLLLRDFLKFRLEFLIEELGETLEASSNDDAEELVVNQISNFMMGVYRDNPWLLDMLKKHLDEIDH